MVNKWTVVLSSHTLFIENTGAEFDSVSQVWIVEQLFVDIMNVVFGEDVQIDCIDTFTEIREEDGRTELTHE